MKSRDSQLERLGEDGRRKAVEVEIGRYISRNDGHTLHTHKNSGDIMQMRRFPYFVDIVLWSELLDT